MEETKPKPKGRARCSRLWNYFTILDDRYANCNTCTHKLSYKTTINNLKKHAERAHGGLSCMATKTNSDLGVSNLVITIILFCGTVSIA